MGQLQLLQRPCLLLVGALLLALFGGDASFTCHSRTVEGVDLSQPTTIHVWKKIRHNSNNVGPRNFSQSANVAIGTNLYVFGGNYQFGSLFYDTFWAFDTIQNQWMAPLPKGPPPRAFPGAAKFNEFFLLYGGTDTFQFDSAYSALGDFWMYSVVKDAWETVDAEPNPGPRTGPTLYVDEDAKKLYLFGGFVDFSTEPPNDVWEFSFVHRKWTQLIANTRPRGLLPLGRNIASGGPVVIKTDQDSGPKLLVYDGEGFNLTSFKFPILDDLWEFDIASRSWSEISIPLNSTTGTPKRNYPGNVVVGDYLYLFGGDVASADGSGICGGVYPENPTDEIWRYNVKYREWEKVILSGRDDFLRVKDQGLASVVNDSIYLVGGYSCENNKRVYMNDVYVLETQCHGSGLEKDSARTSEL